MRYSRYAVSGYPALLRSDFFVSASTREGQSNALLEAMSAGCIPVLFAASGVEDVVKDDETGFIVKERNADALSRTMERAVNLPAQQRAAMAAAVRRFAEGQLGFDAIAERTVAALTLARNRKISPHSSK